MTGRAGLILQRLVCCAIALLPLACWPGLDHPFDSPKLCLLAFIAAALAAQWLLLRSKAARAPRAYDWLWLLWLAALAAPALMAPYVSLEALLLAALPVPIAFALERGVISRAQVCRAVAGASTVMCAIAVLQYAGADPIRWLGWAPEAFANPRMRVYATLGNPDFVAAWCAGVLPLVAVRAAQGDRTRWGASVVNWTPLALHLGALLATGSRVFLLAVPAAAMALLARRAKLRWWWFAAASAILAVAVWLSPGRPLGTTIEGRLYLARVAWSDWRHIPLTGHGPGSFELQFAKQQTAWVAAHPAESAAFAGAVDHAHNDYLEFLIELGPIGLCALLALFGGILWGSRGIQDQELALGCWGGLAAMAAVALVDFPFHRPAEWALCWMLLGSLAGSKIAQSQSINNNGGESS